MDEALGNDTNPDEMRRELFALGNRIRQMREQLDLDQTSCAGSLGVPAWTWNRWERAQRRPNSLVLARWCSLTGGSMDWLYNGRLDTIVNATLALRLAQLNPNDARAQIGGAIGVTTRPGRPARNHRVAA